jgi:hypothetical protein
VRASGLQRWCPWGEHWVPHWEATEVSADEPASGPGMPRYACWTDILAHGLHTIAAPPAAYIGHRNRPPDRPGTT